MCLAPEEALRILEESVFEFQQCRVFTKWEPLANPGRYYILAEQLLLASYATDTNLYGFNYFFV